jgi:hypothetical protein
MIKVGDLVKAREGGDLDCLAFEGEVGLVLEITTWGEPDELIEDEALVEWFRKILPLWECAENLEKLNG